MSYLEGEEVVGGVSELVDTSHRGAIKDPNCEVI